jgi:O-antigen ligase
VGLLVILLVGAVVSLPKLSQGDPVPKKVTGIVNKTFGGVGKAQSADARKNKWAEGARMVQERPVTGWGLGAVHRFFNPGYFGVATFTTGNTFDNTPLDLLVRSGVPGFLLFSWAMVASLKDAWRVWMHHLDPRVAAAGLAVATFLIGITAKAVVESVMEKVVLACALGLAVGMVASARAELDATADGPPLVSSGRTGA